jgi:hypothetical protein
MACTEGDEERMRNGEGAAKFGPFFSGAVSAGVFTYTVTRETRISDTTHICAPDKDAD